MTTLFYASAFFFLIQEVMVLKQPNKWHDFSKRVKKDGMSREDLYKATALYLFTLAYAFWAFIGLFTFQWWAFGILFILSFIPKKTVWLRWLDALLTIILLGFIVLNAFHLQITL